MKKFEDFDRLVADVAYRKQRAGAARFGHTTPVSQKPRDLFVAACAEISAPLTEIGFTFLKSGPAAKRKQPEFTHEILFQSSHNNVAGEYVAVWIHANVQSKRMKKWRADNPYGGSVVHASIGGGQIGNLRVPTAWLEWNLAVGREKQIVSAVHTIKELALPFFSLFDDTDKLTSRLTNSDVPGIGVVSAVEFLLCFASRHEAQDALSSFFKRRPDLHSEYLQFVEKYSLTGVPVFSQMGYAKDLAKATVVFGLRPAAG
jgi:hypothetical protein